MKIRKTQVLLLSKEFSLRMTQKYLDDDSGSSQNIDITPLRKSNLVLRGL